MKLTFIYYQILFFFLTFFLILIKDWKKTIYLTIHSHPKDKIKHKDEYLNPILILQFFFILLIYLLVNVILKPIK